MIRYSDVPVPIEEHGFDTISKDLAERLIKGFKDLCGPDLDTSFNTMFLNRDILDSLLTNRRVGWSDFNGYKFRFGIDDHKKMVLLLNREHGKYVDQQEVYTEVPDIYYAHNSKKRTFYGTEMSRILSHEPAGNGLSFKVIPKISYEYKQFRDNFYAKLGDNGISSSVLVGQSSGQGERPSLPVPTYHSVVGYFIGLGILRSIRPYESRTGIKLFFGYGPSRLLSSYNNFHLIAINAESEDEDIGSNPNDIWATYDIAPPMEVYPINIQQTSTMLRFNSGQFDAYFEPGHSFFSGGSSCVRPEEQANG